MRWRLSLIGLGIAAALLPTPKGLVERYYSTAVFPLFQRVVTAISDLTPVALLDVLLIVLLAWALAWTVALVRTGRRQGWSRAALVWIGRLATGATLVYLAFLTMWGFNYRRVPLIEKVRYDPAAASADAVFSLALKTVEEANRLYDPSRHSRDGTTATSDGSLARAFMDAQTSVGVRRTARPARPKWSILDVYFKAAGVEGMTDPFFLETLVAGELLTFERPFIIAHEWSHLAGFADEGEANFLGWLTCMRASEAAAYSGALFLHVQLFASLTAEERKQVAARLSPGPRANLQAVAERSRRNLRPTIADAGWRIYDRYLKANRVDAGMRSYAEVVRLVLGVRLEPA